MRHLALPTLLLALVGCSTDDTNEPGEPGPTRQAVAADALLPSGCGHAHNDYEHAEPLTDALDRGFCSIEVDVFLEAGELVVAHAKSEIDPARTLRGLYLDPLAERLASGGLSPVVAEGPGGGSLVLLIDVKDEAETTYAALDGLLAEYADLFTSFEDGTVYGGAVTALISGNRDRATMEGQTRRFAALDGRPSDFATGTPLALMPLVSQSWNAYFSWPGMGAMPAEEQAELEALVATAHGESRRLRLWAAPDTEAAWAAQLDAGYDLVNTDDLAGFSTYLASR